MVKLNKIYTRTGDDGTTGLVDGSRVAKYSVRVQAYGDVDEANSFIGVLRTFLMSPGSPTGSPMGQLASRSRSGLARSTDRDSLDIAGMLNAIQNDLFDLGADLATPYQTNDKALRIVSSQVERLEQEIDKLNEGLAPLTSFVLPGGAPASAHAHVARTIVRRAERYAYQLADAEDVNEHALQYLNRLSDYLFVLARKLNNDGKDDVLWVPGENR